MIRVLWFLSLFLAPAAFAQPATPPCSSVEARQLDFWLGEWEVTWDGGQGSNSITRLYGDCVIEENFRGEMPFGEVFGRSVSVWVPAAGQWRQTWVDNQGSYLAFTGGVGADGILRLTGEEIELPDGRTQVSRMSWVNVEEDSLDWHWERTFDDGETWEMVWLIHYKRK